MARRNTESAPRLNRQEAETHREQRVEEETDKALQLVQRYEAIPKEVLVDLEQQFGGTPIVSGDPYMTHARAGAQEVLIYINEKLRVNQDG